MSLFKLFLSGLLVAGGLILGAFTLHGYFDPQWAQKQAQAAKAGPAERPQDAAAINAFQGRAKKFETTTRAEVPAPEAKVQPVSASVVKAPARPDVGTADPKSAQAKATAKAEAKKKAAERPPPADKAKTAQQPQQASFEWLSLKQLFGGN